MVQVQQTGGACRLNPLTLTHQQTMKHNRTQPTARNLRRALNAWNTLTDPSKPRTDSDHANCRTRARSVLQWIERNYIRGLDYKEYESGRLGTIRP